MRINKKIIAFAIIICLALQAIPVFALKSTTPNIALGKPATADSTYGGDMFPPNEANDGNEWSMWSQGYSGMNSFWQVDLQKEYMISKVSILARQDMDDATARENFEIRLSNDASFGTYETVYSHGGEGFAHRDWLHVNVTPTSTYRYLRLQKTDGGYFTLGEVMVYELATSGNSYAAIEGNEWTKAAKLLNYLGIVDINNFDTEVLITRGETLKYAFSLIGIDTDASQNTQQDYYDVPPESPYFGAVQLAKQMGWIDLPEDRLFGPEAFITGDTLAKIILHALGYGVTLEYTGAFPVNVQNGAKNINLFRKINISGNDFIDGKVMLMTLYNALKAPEAEKTFGNGNIELEKGDNLLKTKYHIQEQSGIVTANNVTTLEKADSISKNKVKIDGVEYYDRTGELCDKLGYYTEYFIDTDEENSIVVADCSSGKNKVTVMRGANFASDSLNAGKLRFELDDGTKYNVSLAGKYYVIYNGVADIQYDITDFKGKYTELTFIDNNGDEDAEVIYIDAYDSSIIMTAGKTDAGIKVLLETGDMLILNESGNNCYEKMSTLTGGLATAEMLETGDLITYAVSRNGKAVKLYAGENALSGKVEGLVDEGNEKYYVVDGKEYEVHDSYYKAKANNSSTAKDIEIGEVVDFRMNGNNQIVAVGTSKNTELDYAVLVKAGASDGLDANVQAKIFTRDNKTAIYDFADKIVIDGVKYTKSELADELRSGNASISKASVVRVAFQDGKIKEIDTPDVNATAGETVANSLDSTTPPSELYYKSGYLYYIGNYRIYGRVNANAPMFTIPRDDSGNIRTGEEYEKLFKAYSASFADEYSTDADVLYDFDRDTRVPGAYVEWMTIAEGGGETVDESGSFMLVDRITPAVDDKGEAVTKIIGYSSGGLAEFIVDSSLKSGVVSSEQIQNTAAADVPVTSLKRGDVIQYRSRNDELIAFNMVFDITLDKDRMTEFGDQILYSTGAATYNQFLAYGRAVYGQALKLDGDILTFCDADMNTSDENTIYDRTELYNVSGAKVYIYNENTDRITAGDKSSITDVMCKLNPTGKIMVITKRGSMHFVVGYNFK